jgi:hypothetical protein
MSVLRPIRLSRLRRRLTYANVIATVALFFGLTGASMAGVKYLANGDPAGGDLSGTYPNPTIAAGKITSEKFASDAKAPDADRLDGNDSSDFPRIIAAGTATVAVDDVTLSVGSCRGAIEKPPGIRLTDLVVGSPTGLFFPFGTGSGLVVSEEIRLDSIAQEPLILLSICNVGPDGSFESLPAGTGIRYMVLR